MTAHVEATRSPWLPNEDDFPRRGSVEDALRFCLSYAVLAPSGHNSQPWWFAVDDNCVTVGLDVSRGLAVVDPLDREAVMSVGAAVFTLRVALARFGLSVHIDRWPDPLDPEACVRLTALYGAPIEPDLVELFGAIERRRTSRAAFESASISANKIAELASAAEAEGVHASAVVEEDVRSSIAALVSRADQAQMADGSFRRELAGWLRHAGSRRRDGIHGFTIGSPLDQVLAASPIVVRTFDMGEQRGARDHDLVEGSPLMMVLSTSSDSRDDWLDAGQALARLMLVATTLGLSVGFLDQAIEVPETRADLARLVSQDATPQLVLRVGHGPAPAVQPRRPVEEFLVGPDEWTR